METSFTRYIWKYTSRQQLWILFIVLISMVPYYLSFDLPKLLINGPITGNGFEAHDSVQPFLPGTPFASLELDRMQTLLALSFAFLALVIINGLFKYYINTYKGLMGERLLRRIRFELIDRILRFLPDRFKRIKGAEISSMVKDEVEPMGGFTSEAFVQPVLLSGQALTALGFIFVQHFWLGVVALIMASVQMIFIPRLRRRLLVLGRERQIGARQLAGRVTEIVDGIETIHANDTTNYERADVVTRLAHLFKIRYEIYTRKYKIKFLNNFLAQLTPFLFYFIGGYLAINGNLDVGQLVAVITAYKELPGPLKSLIDWDMARQDVQVKYEQLVEQFDAEDLISSSAQEIALSTEHNDVFPLSTTNVTLEDEGGSVLLDSASLTIDASQSVAVVGDAYSGANIFAEALGGLRKPVKGKISAGKNNLFNLPESITGRKISYVSSEAFMFTGTLKDNLLYGLKNQPRDDVKYVDAEAKDREWELKEALRTGNPVFDLNSNWIDRKSVNGLNQNEDMDYVMRRILEIVQLSDDVFDFALHSTIDTNTQHDLATEIVLLRKAIRRTLDELNLGSLIVPFDMDRYNNQANVLENILFGILTPKGESNTIGMQYFRSVLKNTGLDKLLFNQGIAIAKLTRELYYMSADNVGVSKQLDLIEPDDFPAYKALYERIKNIEFNDISVDDQYAFIHLSFMYVEPHHCFNLLNDDLMKKIVETRKILHGDMPLHLKDGIDLYEVDRYLLSGNLLDNIIFGKIDNGIEGVLDKLREAIAPLFKEQPELYAKIFSIGLDYNVGPSGRRLSTVQRQKLNFARTLIRRSDLYIFNRPISGLDYSQQTKIVQSTLDYISAQDRKPATVWVLATESNAKYFDRRVTFSDKRIIDDEMLSSKYH